MIIYHVPEADAGQRWLPTQDRANACARAFKAEFKAVHAGEDGRDGMCAMLNSAEMEIGARGGDEEVAAPMSLEEIKHSNTPEAQAAYRQLTNPVRDFTAEQIEEFILERANVAQTERIMAALACRFGELVKEKRNG